MSADRRFYFFGVYHWQRRARSAAIGAAALLVSAVLWRVRRTRPARILAALIAVGGARRVYDVWCSLLRAPPWEVERSIYESLADRLPYDEADRAVDVGSGTGRSLVGLAPAIPNTCRVLALDVFDSRVILGNGPRLARWNASRAGLDVTPIRGDAARLPVADDSQDVLTACRVLHDLPSDAARDALAEARRVLRPEGTLGVLELPITHEDSADPETYWCDRVAEAGFEIASVERIPRPDRDSHCIVIVARPG